MSSTKVPEIQIRDQAKLVLKYLKEEHLDKAQEVILQCKEVLSYNFGLAKFTPLIPVIRFSKVIPKNHNALRMVINTGFEIFSKEDNVNELLFFAAAKCDVDKLKYCVEKILAINPENLNQTKEGDTPLLFLVKFGNVTDKNYPECVKVLIEAGVDVNRNDYFSHNPLYFLLTLYNRYIYKMRKDDVVVCNLKATIDMLLKIKHIDIRGVSTDDLLKDFHCDSLRNVPKDEKPSKKDELFKHLLNGNEESFIKFVELDLLDADDGQNTFLQFCCQKNYKNAAKFLIEKGADLTRTTERNKCSPLELAARRNHFEIFELILQTNKLEIGEEVFLVFLRNRPKHIKARYFDEILKYKHLDLTIRSSNGNTPLHYAAIFSSTQAIQVLLKRGASLTVLNDSMKCPLDYINAEDLEKFFDNCIKPDSYNDIDNGKYEVALNYQSLIDKSDSNNLSELLIIEKISNSQKHRELLNHPLLSSFIDIKWKLVEHLYKRLFIFQLIFYLASTLSFLNLKLINFGVFLILAVIYSIRIMTTFSWKNNKLHEAVDIMIVVIMLLSACISSSTVRYPLGIIAISLMTVSFHLFWRFSPYFSVFHSILINIFLQVLSYLFYIFTISLFVGAAYYINLLFQYDSETNNQQISFFNKLKMFFSHFYFMCAFGVFVSVMTIMTIINSLAHLQDLLSVNYQILAYRNNLIFLEYVEKLYSKWKVFFNPLIFEDFYFKQKRELNSLADEGSKRKQKREVKNKNNFVINFQLHLNKFTFEKLVSIKLKEENILKIKKTLTRL